MRPPGWHPPLELSPAEQASVARIRRATLFIFLRRVRHELCTAGFQEELAVRFRDSPNGHPPVPPAQLALVTRLQAYTGTSDDEARDALTMDRRWQLVCDCRDCEVSPLSKAPLGRLRAVLSTQGLARRLSARTVELAAREGGFGPRPLRAARAASPLWGAGRVEDTDNLLGHALRKALSGIARQQGRGLAEVAGQAGAELVAGSRLQAARDLDWDEPAERGRALAGGAGPGWPCPGGQQQPGSRPPGAEPGRGGEPGGHPAAAPGRGAGAADRSRGPRQAPRRHEPPPAARRLQAAWVARPGAGAGASRGREPGHCPRGGGDGGARGRPGAAGGPAGRTPPRPGSPQPSTGP
jgi:hypothetical protein